MYEYDIIKNQKLKKERDISFDEIICLIEDGYIVDVLEHPNQIKYPGQKVYMIDIDEYIWLVPYVENNGKIFLKTAFPSRKHTKQYLEEKNVKKNN